MERKDLETMSILGIAGMVGGLVYIVLMNLYPKGDNDINIVISSLIPIFILIMTIFQRKRLKTNNDSPKRKAVGVKIKNRYARNYFFKN